MNQTRATIIGSIPKLPAACAAWIIPLILSCLMSGIISMINLLRSLGWVEISFISGLVPGCYLGWLHFQRY